MRNANIRAHVNSKTRKVTKKASRKKDAEDMNALLRVNPSEIFFDSEEEFMGDTFFAESFGCSNQFIRQSISKGYLG